MLDTSRIGTVLAPGTYEVEKGQLRFFSKCVGETDPIYFDEAAAAVAGYRSIIAPPTFGFSIARGSSEQLPVVAELGWGDNEIARLLHGEQSFTYYAPMCAGDTITLEEVIVDMFERKKSALNFVVTKTRLTNQLGERVCEMEMTLVLTAEESKS